MQELLIVLKETTSCMLRRSKPEHSSIAELLTADERHQFEMAVQTIRYNLVQAAYCQDPLTRPFINHSLHTILSLTREIHDWHNELFASMLSGEPLPACQQLYDYELELTGLFAWILKTFSDAIDQTQPLPPLFRSENFELISSFMVKARTILQKRSVPSELVNIVLKPFCIFTGNDRSIVYRDFRYVYYYKIASRRCNTYVI